MAVGLSPSATIAQKSVASEQRVKCCDNTHFSELGARRMAKLVPADIRALKLGLADRTV